MQSRHESTSRLIQVIFFIGAVSFSVFSQGAGSGDSNIVGEIQFLRFTSKIFDNTRTLRVLLPPNYHKESKTRYPVLYLNDGQNLFDASLSQYNPMEWKVDETFKRLIEEKAIVPLIIVGIDNAGKRERANEYLPFQDIYLSPPFPEPQGSKYPEFVISEIMPFIENQYRIKKGAKYTGLGGSSYGALIALYTIIKKPNVFGRVLLESPSFYVSDAQILKDAENIVAMPYKVYVGVGTNEEAKADCKPGDLSHEAVQDVLRLEKIFLAKGLKDRDLETVIEDCSIHDEDAYARRFPNALKFLFGKI